MLHKESFVSEESQQSSAMSLELRQKVNDQFQRKKLEFYKMYNKNPQSNQHKHERGKKQNKKVNYQVEGANAEMQGFDDEEEDDYDEDEYDDEDENASPDTKSEKKAKKEEKKKQKAEEK